jgi:hypothetical protein
MTGTGTAFEPGIIPSNASSRVTALRVGSSASGTSRRSASLDGTVPLMSSVICITCQPISPRAPAPLTWCVYIDSFCNFVRFPEHNE